MDLLRTQGGFAEMLKGQTVQAVETADGHFTDAIVHNLFDGEPMGFDLVALNIQRGRDHGIPGYIKYKEICQAGRVNSFEDLASDMSAKNINLLRSVYQNVEDIDLFIGMSLENPAPRQGSLVGRTFLCLIGDQFARLKLGDRYFYDLDGHAGKFTPDQLNEIRKTSLARIICDNTPEITEIQPLVFQKTRPNTNPILPCSSNLNWGIQSVNLSPWAE